MRFDVVDLEYGYCCVKQGSEGPGTAIKTPTSNANTASISDPFDLIRGSYDT